MSLYCVKIQGADGTSREVYVRARNGSHAADRALLAAPADYRAVWALEA